MLGWPIISASSSRGIVLAYITLGGLILGDLQRGAAVLRDPAALIPLTMVGLNKVGGWDGLKDR